MTNIIFLILLAGSLSGCLYEMPGPDTVCTVPLVNNPLVYRDNGPPPMPSVGV